MKIIIPKQFELFGIPHTVKRNERVLDEQGNFGEYNPTHRQVQIYKSMKVPEEILFHEIAEAIAVALELKGEDDSKLPHRVINGFGLGFYNFLVSNPHIIEMEEEDG